MIAGLTTEAKIALAIIGLVGGAAIAGVNGWLPFAPQNKPAFETAASTPDALGSQTVQPFVLLNGENSAGGTVPDAKPQPVETGSTLPLTVNPVASEPGDAVNAVAEPNSQELQPAPISAETSDVAQDTTQAHSEANKVIIPTFDLLRAEPDGSVLIAGQAGAGMTIEAFSGSRKLGEARAAQNGDFVLLLDEPLGTGDYDIVLRATTEDGKSATSTQTAIISVPAEPSAQVLALVQEPGEASRLISVPDKSGTTLVQTEPTTRARTALVEVPQPDFELDTSNSPFADGQDAPNATDSTTQIAEPVIQAQPLETKLDVLIMAVEIEGETVFVAGEGTPGERVRLYANDLLLGDTRINPGGKFLLEMRRDLPVGDYIFRADLIDPKTATVKLRASVPFKRTQGERLAAVAVTPAVRLSDSLPSITDRAVRPTVSDEKKAKNGEGAFHETPTSPAVQTAVTPDQSPQAAQLIQTDQSVIIRRGDTLWQISRRVYGRGVKYTTIYDANTDQIEDPDRIWPGQVFSVPDEADQDTMALQKHRQLRAE